MGKVIVIIFAIVSFLLLPLTIFYIADTSMPPPNYTVEFQGRFYNAKIGNFLGNAGFYFFKFSNTIGNLFSPDSWKQAYSSELVIGMPAGTLMMILWGVGIGLLIIGIILAFFKLKIAGIFFLLAFLVDGLQSIVWWLAMREVYAGNPNMRFFPIPITALFLLITSIIAFSSKKKESYYYSPGYSYGYGRR